MNCHGCKWRDEVKSQPAGSGYCCMVVRSKTQSNKVRHADDERCELYEPGDFATRYRDKKNTNKPDLPGKRGESGGAQ